MGQRDITPNAQRILDAARKLAEDEITPTAQAIRNMTGIAISSIFKWQRRFKESGQWPPPIDHEHPGPKRRAAMIAEAAKIREEHLEMKRLGLQGRKPSTETKRERPTWFARKQRREIAGN